MLLDGKKISSKVLSTLKKEIAPLTQKPTLGAILVGTKDSPSLRYIKQKQKNAEKVGINFEFLHFEEDITQQHLLDVIHKWNTDTEISGFIVQLPLPKHIDTQKVIYAISPEKDVDGFHPINQGKVIMGDNSGFTPCTPAGIMKLFDEYNIELSGKKVVIIGKSNIVGKPLIGLCINKGATVTSCNSQTPNLQEFTKHADIIISATGIPDLLTIDMLGKKTVVIDVGFSIVDGEIVGDSDVRSIANAGYDITPVPGGVGPMTVSMLLQNTLQAYKQLGTKK